MFNLWSDIKFTCRNNVPQYKHLQKEEKTYRLSYTIPTVRAEYGRLKAPPEKEGEQGVWLTQLRPHYALLVQYLRATPLYETVALQSQTCLSTP